MLSPVPLAIMQGMQMQSWFAFFQGFNGVARFLFCGLAALIGFGVNGVMVGMFLSLVFIWAWSYFVVKKNIGVFSPVENHVSFNWKQAMPVLVGNFSFALLTQIDLILVNRLFPPQEASIYASAAVLGRAVVYIPGALVLAMFPMVAEQRAKNLKTHVLLIKSLLLTIFISGIGAALFFIWPQEILGFLFSNKYDASAPILKFYGLNMLSMAVVMVLFHYLIARGDSLFGFFMLIGAIIEIYLIYQYHQSPLSIVFILGGVGTVLLVVGLVFSWFGRPLFFAGARNYASSIGA